MRGSFGCWLWAGKWKLCAAMREAFCVWQGTRAGSSTDRTSGNHQAARALGALSLLVFQFLGGRLKLFLVYRLGDRERKEKKPESPQPFLQPELLSTSLPERKCVCVCDQLMMVWVINMACWDPFSIPSWLSGSGLQRQTKSTLSLRSACCTFEGSLPSLLLPHPHPHMPKKPAWENEMATVLLAFGTTNDGHIYLNLSFDTCRRSRKGSILRKHSSLPVFSFPVQCQPQPKAIEMVLGHFSKA